MMHSREDMDTQRKAIFGRILAVGEAIRELGSVPSGHLYARLMVNGIDMETYNFIIRTLERSGMISNKGHLLTWIGPHKKEQA